ncbi:MAG: glycosyltransferase [Candidatus Symbiothrix sp.]|jgi:glycosyltransferase involved in cell wall biosynthesis|nr:glycosyltransferase [Candidatus Symbiothrix sp.]
MARILKLAIVRTSNSSVDVRSYNVQEIGLAKGLLNCGVSTDFYAIFQDLELRQTIATHNACEINLIPIKGLAFFGKITYFPKLIGLLIRNDYDVVQVHEDSQLMTLLILKKCHDNGIKTVLYQGMYVHYKGINYIYQYFLDLFFKKTIQRNTNIMLAKTSLAKKYLEAKEYKDVTVLPVGLDYEKEQKPYHSRSKLEEFKARYDKLLLYVGKIEKRRNPFFLIDILSHLDANIALLIVGDGPLYAQMMEYAKKKNEMDRLLVIKSVSNSEISDIYKICNVFLFPTNYEIYGMVVMEALFNGIPVISTPEAGPLAILTDEKLGVCLPLDIRMWIDKILYYFNCNNADIHTYRTEAVKKKYDWNVIAEQYCEMVFYINYRKQYGRENGEKRL